MFDATKALFADRMPAACRTPARCALQSEHQHRTPGQQHTGTVTLTESLTTERLRDLRSGYGLASSTVLTMAMISATALCSDRCHFGESVATGRCVCSQQQMNNITKRKADSITLRYMLQACARSVDHTRHMLDNLAHRRLRCHHHLVYAVRNRGLTTSYTEPAHLLQQKHGNSKRVPCAPLGVQDTQLYIK